MTDVDLEFRKVSGGYEVADGPGGDISDGEFDVVIPSEYKGEPVTGIGKFAFARRWNMRSVSIPETVERIGEGAFLDCGTLEEISGAEGVRRIGTDAFRSCAFRMFTVPSGCERIGQDAFYGCQRLVEILNLSSLDIRPGEYGRPSREGLRGVNVCRDLSGAGTFFETEDEFRWYRFTDPYGNDRRFLTGYDGGGRNIRLPETCEGLPYEVHGGAFEDGGIDSVEIPSGVRDFGADAFLGCFSLRVCVEDLRAWLGMRFETPTASPLFFGDTVLFVGGEPVTDLEIPSGTEEIGNFAFAGGPFESVVLPEGVTRVGRGAFARCLRLRSVSLPASLLSIGGGAFSGCRGLQSVTLPGNLASVGERAFHDCESLFEVVNLSRLSLVPGDGGYGGVAEHAKAVKTSVDGKGTFFTDEEGYMFYDSGDRLWLYGYSGKEKSLTLPVVDGRTYEICGDAFRQSPVTDVRIPSCVSSVGDAAFAFCTCLKRVSLGDGVAYVGDWAFEDCFSLEDFLAGSGLLAVGNHAFSGCHVLGNVCLPDGFRYIGDGAFEYCRGLCSIVLPRTVTRIGRGAFYTPAGLASRGLDVLLLGGPEGLRQRPGEWNEPVISDPWGGPGCFCDPDGRPVSLYRHSAERPRGKGKFWHYDEAGGPVKW